jgi:steroid 5-alpha reductase family enzyme
VVIKMGKLKKNRALSFLIVVAIYALATVVGVVTYNILTFDWWLSLLIADVVATVFTFIFSLIFKNASVYDPYWSVQPPVILVALAIGRELTALGVLLIVAVFFWAISLTANWAYTFYGLDHQDWRYTMLSEKTGKFYPLINFIGIHMVPTLVVYLCILPAAYAILNGTPLSPISVVFILVSIGAASLQGIADIEMHKYKKNRDTKFIRIGLWKYSRHPNYLGEILMWWGIGLAVVLSAPEAWYLLLGALANTALFFFVSIPMADGRQSKKDGFAEYKAETRMLLPIKK